MGYVTDFEAKELLAALQDKYHGELLYSAYVEFVFKTSERWLRYLASPTHDALVEAVKSLDSKGVEVLKNEVLLVESTL